MTAIKVEVWGVAVLVSAEMIAEMEARLVDASRLSMTEVADCVIVAGTPTNIATIAAAAAVDVGRVIQRSGSFVDVSRAEFVVLGTPILFDAQGDSLPYGVSRRPKRP